MTTAPTNDDRLLQCRRPKGPVVMYQDWTHLLFLHWEVSPESLRPTLPPGLTLDLYEGRAYLGVVPFFMRNIRPRFCPCVPGISNFLEMNLRTYVFDEQGRPGVWFYSLDANQALAVGLARRLFYLPYQHAKMQAAVDSAGWIDYRSQRAWTGVESRFHYRGDGHAKVGEVGSLEFFLAERYLLYAYRRNRLWSGRVYHTPYPLESAELERHDDRLLMLNGFPSTGRPADHAHFASGVQVDVYPLLPQTIASGSS